MKNKIKYIIFIFTIIVITFAFIGKAFGFFDLFSLFGNRELVSKNRVVGSESSFVRDNPFSNIGTKTMQTKQATSSAVSNASTTSLEWKSYRNKEFGFEFKYPGDMKIIQRPNVDKTPIFYNGQNFSFSLDIFDKKGREPNWDIYENGPGPDSKSFFLDYPNESDLKIEKKLISENKNGNKFINHEKQIKCQDNVPEYALCYIEDFGSNLYGLIYYFHPLNGNTSKFVVFFNPSGDRYLIEGSGHGYYDSFADFKNKSKDELSVFNKIVSTFKFIEPNKKDELNIEKQIQDIQNLTKNAYQTDWLTFNNEDYRYSIKYPANWPLQSNKLDNVTIGIVPYEPSSGFISVLVSPLEENTTLENFISDFGNFISKKEIVISGVKAYNLVYKEPFAGQEEENYIFEKEGNIFQIYYIRAEDGFDKICNEIINSFKFN